VIEGVLPTAVAVPNLGAMTLLITILGVVLIHHPNVIAIEDDAQASARDRRRYDTAPSVYRSESDTEMAA